MFAKREEGETDLSVITRREPESKRREGERGTRREIELERAREREREKERQRERGRGREKERVSVIYQSD